MLGTIFIQNSPQKGIMTSPSYGKTKFDDYILYETYRYSIYDIHANFIVKEITGSPIIKLKIDDSYET